MTRVLVVDEEMPWPADSGKRIRTTELLRRLAADFEVALVAPVDPSVPASALEGVRRLGIEPIAVPRAAPRKRGLPFAWDCVRNLFTSRPYMAMAHRSRAVADRVRTEAARRDVDLVHVEWTPLVENVPDDLRLPVCVSAHNVEADVWERAALAERSRLRRAYVRLQAKKVRSHEVAWLARADAVVAVSEHDARRIRERTGRDHVAVVENGVDAQRFAPDPAAAVEPGSMVFVGSLDWRPNQDGVVWFVDEVWPRLRRRRPDATLRVVGRSPPAWVVDRLRIPGVTLHASVPDVRPHVATAALAVVPLRVGGGSRLKICEALAMGRPVLSTTVGAEGLSLDGGVEIADDADAFAAAAARTLDDPADALRRAAAGRRAVLERHEWGRLARAQGDVWRRLVEARSARRASA